MKNIFVTGGAGFIGSHIVDSFVAEGFNVSVMDDLSSGSKENLPENIPLFELDIRTPEARECIKSERPDILVHAAAQMSVTRSMEDPHFDAEVNICGLINLLQAFEPNHLPYILFISTGGAIYGEQSVFPASEDHPIAPESPYGLAKRVEEMYLDFWGRKLGLHYGVVRLANIYGPRQNPHGEAGVVAIFNKKLLAGEIPTIFGTGEQTRDFVFVRDVAKAVERMCIEEVEGIFNIGTGIETSVDQLYEIICRSLNVSVVANREVARPGEQMRSVIDASLAEKEFGWKPAVSVEEGLKITSEWFREKF